MKTRQQVQSACPVCGASLPHTHPTAIERCKRLERQQREQQQQAQEKGGPTRGDPTSNNQQPGGAVRGAL